MRLKDTNVVCIPGDQNAIILQSKVGFKIINILKWNFMIQDL